MSSDFLTLPVESFLDLGLNTSLQRALEDAGYSEPTPIQAKMIPHVLAGRDVIGQAQTGTGKTAAFALPLLNNLRPGKKIRPQVLVLAPTRELAIQVADSFESYGKHINQLKVLAIYGGGDYVRQLRELDRGVHVVVGTPGRVMDHVRRGALDLSFIRSLVLDEADEMLKMGFLEDVEWILSQTPEEKQVALFSATMPASIRKIASDHLREPVEITIKSGTVTASTVSQRFLVTRSMQAKKEALERVLETLDFGGVLVFVRTKNQTVELAEHLAALGYGAAALNGDIAQNQRIRTVEQLKSAKIDILVATDVAARGLDVERISHVINYDIPFDTESYIHRIGRTGRAGRAGEAILFVAPREMSTLKSIERVTKKKVEEMAFPSAAEINERRLARYKARVSEALAGDNRFYERLIAEFCQETGAPVERVAGALARLVQGEQPLFVQELALVKPERGRAKRQLPVKKGPGKKNVRRDGGPQPGMERYRIAVGGFHGVKPGNIVGAIANEVDMDSSYIGRISIYDEFSTVELPAGMPRQVRKVLERARINGRLMRLHPEEGAPQA